MATVNEQTYARILREAEEGARLAARSLSTQVKDLENAGYREMTAAEVAEREQMRVRRAVEYAEWRIAAFERGECDSPW